MFLSFCENRILKSRADGKMPNFLCLDEIMELSQLDFNVMLCVTFRLE